MKSFRSAISLFLITVFSALILASCGSSENKPCTECKDENGDYIWFEQKTIDGTNFVVDNESGYTRINNIENFEVYYRFTDPIHVYVWNDGKYSMNLASNYKLSNGELILILQVIVIK